MYCSRLSATSGMAGTLYEIDSLLILRHIFSSYKPNCRFKSKELKNNVFHYATFLLNINLMVVI